VIVQVFSDYIKKNHLIMFVNDPEGVDKEIVEEEAKVLFSLTSLKISISLNYFSSTFVLNLAFTKSFEYFC
jgi:hypothetical protein